MPDHIAPVFLRVSGPILAGVGVRCSARLPAGFGPPPGGEAGAVHGLAGELVAIPADGLVLVLGVGPAPQIGLLALGVLGSAGDAGIDGGVLGHGGPLGAWCRVARPAGLCQGGSGHRITGQMGWKGLGKAGRSAMVRGRRLPVARRPDERDEEPAPGAMLAS